MPSRRQPGIPPSLVTYRWWFELFGVGASGFLEFVDFFFLTPMLDSEGRVKSFGSLGLAFERALPKGDEASFCAYIADELAFVRRRNELIEHWWSLT